MKTYEEFRDEILRSPRFKEMTFAELENEAAKEYAKQWVHEFALQTFHHLDEYNYNVMLTQLEPRIIKQIDAQ